MTVTSVGLSNLFSKNLIMGHCNGNSIDNLEELQNEIEESLLEINNRLASVDDMELFNICYGIKHDGSIVKDIILNFNFKAEGGNPEKCSIPLSRTSFEDFKADFENIMQLIIDGYKAVSNINTIIKRIQSETGALVAISYKWSISNKVCHIVDWDYNKIKIKLNKSSVASLIEIENSEDINDILLENNWTVSIKEFIENFNGMTFHSKIGAIISVAELESILTENMLTTEDVIAIVRRNKDSQGTQCFKSVSIVKELGRFIIICNWIVDYSKRKLSMKIMDDKIFDAESGRFINDRDLCRRVEQRISIPESTVSSWFENSNT